MAGNPETPRGRGEDTTIESSKTSPPPAERVLALRCVVGQAQGMHYRLVPGVNVVGRSEEADIRLADHGVSRNHVEVVLERDGTVMVNDLGAKNGTFVDRRRIDSAPLPVGGTVGVGSDVVLQLVVQFRTEQAATTERLTKREREVLLLVGRALSNEEIAGELGIKRRTVETYLERIYAKTGLKSRIELYALAVRDAG